MMPSRTIMSFLLQTLVSFLYLAQNVESFSSIQSSRRTTTRLNAFSAADASTALSSLDAFYQNEPYVAAFLTCSVKASAADWVSQSNPFASNEDDEEVVQESQALASSTTESEDDIDVRRNLAFWLYGGLYQGMAQQYLYGTLFPALFGTSLTLSAVATQVFADICFIGPLLCLPVAYVVKASVSQEESLLDGLIKYKDHVLQEGLWTKYATIWVPVQFLTFGVIPQHLRIVFIAAVSFFWLMILSSVSAKQGQEQTSS